MAFDNPRLITPPREEEEIYPYRRVWRSLVITGSLLSFLVIVFFVLFGIIGFAVPDDVRFPVNLVLALVPALLWLLFSRLPENRVMQPRTQLTQTCIVSALTAGAIGIPLIEDFLQPASWLALASTQDRIIGYMVTTGIVHEFLKYLILRYSVRPESYRLRTDAVAYGVATATGYAMVLSIQYVINTPDSSLDATMMRVFTFWVSNLVTTTMLSYGMVEMTFDRAPVFLMPIMLLLSALVSALITTLRAGFINGAMGLTGSATRPLFGLGFTLIVLIAGMAVMFFLYRVADQREQDVLRSQEV